MALNLGGSLSPIPAAAIVPDAAAQLGQALSQLPQLKLQYEQQKAQTDAEKFQTASQRIAFLGTLAANDPNIAKSANYKAMISTAFSDMGMQAPLMPDGSVDITALGAHTQSQQYFMQHPEAYTMLQTMNTEDRQAWSDLTGIPLPPSVMAMKQMAVSDPAQAIKIVTGVSQDLFNLGVGNITAPYVYQEIQLAKKGLAGTAWESGLDPILQQLMSPGVLGPKTAAYIQAQLSAGLLKREQATKLIEELPYDLAKIKSEADLKGFMAKYYEVKATDQQALDTAMIRYRDAEATAAMARADASEAKAAQLTQQVNSALALGGLDPKAFKGAVDTLSTQLRSDQNDLATLKRSRDNAAAAKAANAGLGTDAGKAAAMEANNAMANYDHRIQIMTARVKNEQDAYDRGATKLQQMGGIGAPAPDPKQPQPKPSKGYVSAKLLQEFASKHGQTLNQAKAFLQGEGYTVE